VKNIFWLQFLNKLQNKITTVLSRKINTESKTEIDTWAKDIDALIKELQKPTFPITPTLQNEIPKLQNIAFIMKQNPTQEEIKDIKGKSNEIIKDVNENENAPIKAATILNEGQVSEIIAQINGLIEERKSLSESGLTKWQKEIQYLLEGDNRQRGYLTYGNQGVHKAAVNLRKALEESGITVPLPTDEITPEGAAEHKLKKEIYVVHFSFEENFENLKNEGLISESDLKKSSGTRQKEREDLVRLKEELDKNVPDSITTFNSLQEAKASIEQLNPYLEETKRSKFWKFGTTFGQTWPYAILLQKIHNLNARIGDRDKDNIQEYFEKNITTLFIKYLMSAYAAKFKEIESIVQGKNQQAQDWKEKDIVKANNTSSDILDKLMISTELMCSNGNENLLGGNDYYVMGLLQINKKIDTLTTLVNTPIRIQLNGFLSSYISFINNYLNTAQENDENEKNLLINSLNIASALVQLSNLLLGKVFAPLFPYDDQLKKLNDTFIELKKAFEDKFPSEKKELILTN